MYLITKILQIKKQICTPKVQEIHSFNEYLLSTNCASGTALSIRYRGVDKKKSLSSWSLHCNGVCQAIHKFLKCSLSSGAKCYREKQKERQERKEVCYSFSKGVREGPIDNRWR